ncbi:MAG: helix-turn-helix transcriptional regulator [Xanthomonadales bacterium]|nr:helix-turn-helix transcriptional regulator [Xanthomonadales bacterium]
MGREKYLGEFEFLVIAALLRLGKNAYGVSVRSEIKKRTGRQVSFGAVYTTLDRLESKSLVRSRSGEATPSRGGRPKKHFEVTARGVDAMKRTLESVQSMVDGIDTAWNLP